MTIELPDITIEELTTLHPRARCTPRLGPHRVLPTKTTATSGIMRWRWQILITPRPIDGALIQIGDRTWDGHVGNGDPIWFRPGDEIELWARLQDFPA